MSLLAELLSRVKHPTQSKREIPPNLRDIVSLSARRSAYVRKIVLISLLFVVAIAAGISTVYVLKPFSPEVSKKAQTQHASLEVEKPSPPKQVDEIQDVTVEPAPPFSTAMKRGFSSWSIRQRIASARKTASVPAPLAGKPEKQNEKQVKNDKSAKKDVKEAREKTEIAEKIDAYLYSAKSHELRGDYTGALSDYRKILKLDRNNYTVMNNMAYIFLKLGMLQESIHYSKRAVALQHDYVPGLVNLAIAYATAGNREMSETYLLKALTVEPANKNILSNLAILYERDMDLQKASLYFSRLAKLGDVNGILGLARIYEKQDRKEDARRIYRELLAGKTLEENTRELVRERLDILSQK
jgi:Flp pilus assembly protein TadD